LKLVLKLAVVVTALFATIGVVSTPAFATTCYTGGGDSSTFAISRCGSTSLSWTFNHSGCVTGHPEIWAYGTNTLLNYGEGVWCGGDGSTLAPAPWDARSCVEFWVPNGTGWSRLGSSVCTSH
jgi:hypothetical protein